MNKLQDMSADIEELKVKSVAPKKTFADMFENTPRSSKRHTGLLARKLMQHTVLFLLRPVHPSRFNCKMLTDCVLRPAISLGQ
jgi:hypothetical protein